jgi:hypothetical protein
MLRGHGTNRILSFRPAILLQRIHAILGYARLAGRRRHGFPGSRRMDQPNRAILGPDVYRTVKKSPLRSARPPGYQVVSRVFCKLDHGCGGGPLVGNPQRFSQGRSCEHHGAMSVYLCCQVQHEGRKRQGASFGVMKERRREFGVAVLALQHEGRKRQGASFGVIGECLRERLTRCRLTLLPPQDRRGRFGVTVLPHPA